MGLAIGFLNSLLAELFIQNLKKMFLLMKLEADKTQQHLLFFENQNLFFQSQFFF